MSNVHQLRGVKREPVAAPARPQRSDAERALSFATRLEEAARLIRLALHEDAPFTHDVLAEDERLALSAMPEFLERKAEKFELVSLPFIVVEG